jgi:HlyD family secretion protein
MASEPGPGDAAPDDQSERRRTRTTRFVRIVLIVLVVGTFLGIPAARVLFAPDVAGPTDAPTPVRAGAPILADAERTVRYAGTLTPEATTTILPRVSGRVTAIPVRQNQLVDAGDVIARIEDDALRLQVEQARAAFQAADAQYRQAVRGVRSEELEIARAEVEQAETELETARSNLERTERLYEAEAVSRSDYESAVDRFQSAQTQVANARRRLDLMESGVGDEELAMARANADAAARQLELAELQLDYATVRTPVAGSVARVTTEVGQMVGTESPIAAVVNDRLIYARITIPERFYGGLRGSEGTMPVRIHPEAYPDDPPFEGTVSTVASIIDAASRTFEVEVAIPNADGRLRPGMYVNAVFVLESWARAMQIPDAAVYRRDGDTVVYTVETASVPRARAVPVRVEDLPGDSTLVHDGLDGSEELIVEGAAFLADGERVEVVEDP